MVHSLTQAAQAGAVLWEEGNGPPLSSAAPLSVTFLCCYTIEGQLSTRAFKVPRTILFKILNNSLLGRKGHEAFEPPQRILPREWLIRLPAIYLSPLVWLGQNPEVTKYFRSGFFHFSCLLVLIQLLCIRQSSDGKTIGIAIILTFFWTVYISHMPSPCHWPIWATISSSINGHNNTCPV